MTTIDGIPYVTYTIYDTTHFQHWNVQYYIYALKLTWYFAHLWLHHNTIITRRINDFVPPEILTVPTTAARVTTLYMFMYNSLPFVPDSYIKFYETLTHREKINHTFKVNINNIIYNTNATWSTKITSTSPSTQYNTEKATSSSTSADLLPNP